MRVSSNGRYFINTEGKPVFWLGDTQWELFRGYSLDDAIATLKNRQEKGFSFIQVMLLGVKFEANIKGEAPFRDNDPLKPNENYFRHVDNVIEQAEKISGLTLVIGVYHKNYPKDCFQQDNARAWAKWLAQRYRDTSCIIWSMYPEATQEYVPICRELANGLREGDGGAHLITVHPDPSPESSGSLFHQEKWLDFNSIQTFKDVELIYPMTTEDYSRIPVKPVVMAEGAYEEGTEYGFEVTPLWLRRQAYYSYLAGGHHSYGNNASWRIQSTWREALDSPGAGQMGVLKQIFLELREWWELIPDSSLLAIAPEKEEKILTLSSRHPKGLWAMVYAGAPVSFTLKMDKLGEGNFEADWIDPRTGKSIKKETVPGLQEKYFSTPAGLEDAILILKLSSK